MKTTQFIFTVTIFIVTVVLFSACKKDQLHTVIGNYNTTRLLLGVGIVFDSTSNQLVLVKDIGGGNISVEAANLKYNLTNSDTVNNHFSCDSCGFVYLNYFPENDSIEFIIGGLDTEDIWRGRKIQ